MFKKRSPEDEHVFAEFEASSDGTETTTFGAFTASVKTDGSVKVHLHHPEWVIVHAKPVRAAAELREFLADGALVLARLDTLFPKET